MSSDRVFCPHCGFDIARRTYRLHKGLYFDTTRRSWNCNSCSETEESRLPEEYLSDQPEIHVDEGHRFEEDEVSAFMNWSKEISEEVDYENLGKESQAKIWERTKERYCREFFIGNNLGAPGLTTEDTVTSKIAEAWDEIDANDFEIGTSQGDQKSTGSIQINDEQKMHVLALCNWIILILASWAAHCNISGGSLENLLLILKAVFQSCNVFFLHF